MGLLRPAQSMQRHGADANNEDSCKPLKAPLKNTTPWMIQRQRCTTRELRGLCCAAARTAAPAPGSPAYAYNPIQRDVDQEPAISM
jgi:hypothetical protein